MKKLLIVISLIIMSIYPIYRNFYYGRANLQYERHIAIIEKRSDFYNPWQYRILCPIIIEGLLYIYDHTIDKVFPIEDKIKNIRIQNLDPKENTISILANLGKEGYAKYLIVFVFFRMIENVLIYILLFYFLKYFLKNRGIIILGLLFASLVLGNSVNDSDLALHTYFDVILYLAAGIVIIYQKHWYILPISILGAMNRETSILIPFLYFISFLNLKNIDLKKWNQFSLLWPGKKVFAITVLSYSIFLAVFVFIRYYYGYVSQTEFKVASGLPMLMFNLLSFHSLKTYMEMYGVFTILPLISVFVYRHSNHYLKIWFWGLVPVWFLIHFFLVVAYQSRLFLVPTFLIFLPMFLEYIEISFRNSLITKPQ